jgi:hypothetical protein
LGSVEIPPMLGIGCCPNRLLLWFFVILILFM